METPHPVAPEEFGKYQLVRRLAFGGMAEIFLAKMQGDQGFAKTVVLKRILPQFGTDDAFVRMFIDEAVIAARLTHPNVVQIYDFGEVEGVYYIAMEWVDGVDLNHILKNLRRDGRRLSPAQVAAIGEDICRGLGYVHNFADEDGVALNIVHRDISPHNIMLARAGVAKVMDFGIAKAEERATRTKTGMIKGKLAYMAPEQARGLHVDKRADQFAVGLVLWECLTGVRLFKGDSDFELLRQVAECETRHPSEFRDDVPAPLTEAIMRALAPRPDERFDDLAQLEHALSSFRFSLGSRGAVTLSSLVDETAPRRAPANVRRTLPLESDPPPPQNPPPERGAPTLERGSLPNSPNAGEHTMVTPKETPPSYGWDEVLDGGMTETAKGSDPLDVGRAPQDVAIDDDTQVVEPEDPPVRSVASATSAGASAPTAGGANWEVSPSPKGRRRLWGALALVGVLLLAVGLGIWRGRSNEPGPAAWVDLQIQSAPSGADIRVDGISVGLNTPGRLPAQPVGTPVELELRLPGYEVVKRRVIPSPSNSLVHIELVPTPKAKAEVSLTSGQDDAPDGASVTTTSLSAPDDDLPPSAKARPRASSNTSAPTATAKRRPPVEPSPEPEARGKGAERRRRSALGAEPGYLSLRFMAGWANVYWGKKLLGSTPLHRVELPAGTHELRLVNPDTGERSALRVEIQPGQHTKKTARF